MVSTAWMESMKGRTSGSSAINPNAAGSNIVRGLTEPDTALAPIKDNDAALRVPPRDGLLLGQHISAVARVYLEVLPSTAGHPCLSGSTRRPHTPTPNLSCRLLRWFDDRR